MQLHDAVTTVSRLTDSQKAALHKLHITTIRDLLLHFPARYEEEGNKTTTSALTLGENVVIIGTLEKLETKKAWKSRMPISEGYIRDQSGRVKAMWFNQPYIAKMWLDGTRVKATGKVAGSVGKLYLANPQLSRAAVVDGSLFEKEEKVIDISDGADIKNNTQTKFTSHQPSHTLGEWATKTTNQLLPVYAESYGITSLWIRHAILKILNTDILTKFTDPIPEHILKKYSLPTLATALHWIHQPETSKQSIAARKRFAFEEIFYIQLQRQKERRETSCASGFPIYTHRERIDEFIGTLPFSLTTAQNKSVDQILADLQKTSPMSRLLEGDVGSGKTIVAATAAFAVMQTKPDGKKAGALQTAYMAPTEILAKQHFESFIKIFEKFPVPVGLITGSGCLKFPSKSSREKATKISRTQLLKWVGNGEIPILIGTHALIQDAVAFKHLALVIIDEQHRFGTDQRRKLARKGERMPHLLSMTATPIPRTLALTVYGDLDLTILDGMPPGRKPIITEIVSPEHRAKAYERMREELRAGRQAYVICPRIEEPDPEKAFAMMAKSVVEESARLKRDVFPEYEFDILHSKMKPAEKDASMLGFVKHETNILVATSVVEVGVNVPNATVMLVEGAERFGLAQLHQLRGRIVRSTHQAYCFVVAESRGENTRARLKALANAQNGFELAEMDLRQRGAGELAGGKQWGISDIGMEALENLKLVSAARTEAINLITQDENLSKYPLLASAVSARAQKLHFE